MRPEKLGRLYHIGIGCSQVTISQVSHTCVRSFLVQVQIQIKLLGPTGQVTTQNDKTCFKYIWKQL